VTANGLLVANKSRGVTSHDVVNEARRLYGTRAVGHAGTLDPMATGVLVLLFGEATKLSSFLTQDDKEYLATVEFGRATDTLDADGNVVSEQPLLPNWLDEAQLSTVLERERARTLQEPPGFSAISLDGVRAHRRARRGEAVVLEPREVSVKSLEVVGRGERSIRFSLRVSKGYYVRAFARDVGSDLGLPAHLSELVRVASGSFRIEQAVVWPPAEVPKLMPVADAARLVLPEAVLTPVGAQRATAGQTLSLDHFSIAPPDPAISAWFDAAGRLIAVGRPGPEGTYRVVRGFRTSS